jgi:hypothetical protein
MKKNYQNFSVVSLNQQSVPVIREDVKTRFTWVPFGITLQMISFH